MLNADLEGKGILKMAKPKDSKPQKATKKTAGSAKPAGTHPTFGELIIVKKVDSSKHEFAALVISKAGGAAGPQLCQASALSVRCNFELGVDLMTAVAKKAIADGINDKKELNPLRDAIRESEFKDRIEALPQVSKPKAKPKAKPQVSKPTVDETEVQAKATVDEPEAKATATAEPPPFAVE